MSNIVIAAAARTPMGGFMGDFKDVVATELGATVVREVVKRAHLKPDEIEEIIMGCVLPAGQGQAPARQAAIRGGLAEGCGATTVNKMCGSGMRAVMIAHDQIKSGSNKIILAGGMESMSNAPYLLPKARAGMRMGHSQAIDHMFMDGLEDAYDKGKLMGVFAEMVAEHYNFSRAAQDEFAITSLDRAQKAISNGWLSPEITPVLVQGRKDTAIITKDEQPLKADASKIPTLRPAFKPDGTVTAANASSISDGAAALVLMPEDEAIRRGITPLARIVGHATYAGAPSWFGTAPIGSIKKLCEKTGWKLSEIDLFEINEAFAVVAMAAMKELSIPHDITNIHGGACALGHPIGASGARILVTLINALKKNNLRRGIASLCIGGGEATAVAVEIM